MKVYTKYSKISEKWVGLKTYFTNGESSSGVVLACCRRSGSREQNTVRYHDIMVGTVGKGKTISLCHEIGHVIATHDFHIMPPNRYTLTATLQNEIIAWELAWGVYFTEYKCTKKNMDRFLDIMIICLDSYYWGELVI